MIATQPLRRHLRLFVVAAVTMTVTLGGGFQIASAQAPQAYKATPSFTKQWKKAKRSFARCQYAPSWKTYKSIRKRGTRLADIVQRVRFYEGLATSAWMRGYKQTAKRYADQGVKLESKLTPEQHTQLQTPLYNLSRVQYREYDHWCYSQVNK